MFRVIITLILCLILSACSPVLQSEEPPSGILIETPTIQRPTSTSTLLARSTATQTSQPLITKTSIPSITASPSPIPVTPTPFDTSKPGLMTTLGEQVASPWYPGIPVFSPDGQNILLASQKIRLWNINTYQFIREFQNPYPEGCYLSNASFSPDGSLVAVSITSCWSGETSTGHLVIWDVKSGEVLHDWEQAYARMTDPKQGPYSLAVSAMAFLPASTRLAFANGNTIEIRDAQGQDEPIRLDLGEAMYASEISLQKDSDLLYVLMSWDKLNDFPANYRTKFKAQVWDLKTQRLHRELDFPEAPYPDEAMELLGSNLLHTNFVDGVFEKRNLVTDEISQLSYRKGWRFLSQDGRWVIIMRYFGFEEQEQAVELWNMETRQNPYVFEPNFRSDWYYGVVDVAFNADNTILAIAHQEQVSLWNILPITNP